MGYIDSHTQVRSSSPCWKTHYTPYKLLSEELRPSGFNGACLRAHPIADAAASAQNIAMGTQLRVALAQYLSDRDPATVVEEAKCAAAEIVVFPEMYSNGYAHFGSSDGAAAKRWREAAHHPDGSYIHQFREAAIEHHIHVVATFLEAAEPKPYNSASLIDPHGQTVLHHRKVHICDFADSPDAACGRGNQFLAAEIKTAAGLATIGLMICMDREYPEAPRSLSGAGAEIALVPNCCQLATDPTVGDVRIAQMGGRSFESVMGIAVANYPKPRADGHSFATDPTGAIIALADDSPSLCIAVFDLQQIRRIRREDHFRI